MPLPTLLMGCQMPTSFLLSVNYCSNPSHASLTLLYYTEWECRKA